MASDGHTNLAMEMDDNAPPSSSSTGYAISWANLGYSVSQGKMEKEILSRLYGIVHPGSMVAVLGASGAGKSSFLDVLANRKPFADVSGTIAINGHTTIPMKHVSRYCVQEEALYGNLTVHETLMYAADFNLPKSTPRKQKQQIVKDLLNEFGLARVRDTIIGTPLRKGCSGGQVRRVSVASQIVGLTEGILFLGKERRYSGLCTSEFVESTSVFSVTKTSLLHFETRRLGFLAQIKALFFCVCYSL